MSFARWQQEITRQLQRKRDVFPTSAAGVYKTRLKAGVLLSTVLLIMCGTFDLVHLAKTPPFLTTLPVAPPLQTIHHGVVVSNAGAITLNSIGKPVSQKRRVFWDDNATLLLSPTSSTAVMDWEWNAPTPGKKRFTLPHRISWKVNEVCPSLDFKVASTSPHTEVVSQSWQTPTPNRFGTFPKNSVGVSAEVSFPPSAQTGAVLLGVAPTKEAITFAQVPMPGRFDVCFGTNLFTVSEHLPRFTRPDDRSLTLTVTLPDLPREIRTRLPLYAYKIYAVDWWGNAFPATGWSSSKGDKEVVVYWTNRSASSVRFIRLVIAPYYWFDWREVPLDWHGARTASALVSTPPKRSVLQNHETSRRERLLLAVNARKAPSVQIAELVPDKINIVAGIASGDDRSSPNAAFTTYVPYWLLQEGSLDASLYGNYSKSIAPAYTHAINNDKEGLACLEWRFQNIRQEEADSFHLHLRKKYD